MENKIKKNLYITKEENDLILKKSSELGVTQNDFIRNCIYYFNNESDLIVDPTDEISEIKSMHNDMENIYKKLIKLCTKTLNMEKIRSKNNLNTPIKKYKTSCNDFMLDEIYKIQNNEEKNKQLVNYFIGIDIK